MANLRHRVNPRTPWGPQDPVPASAYRPSSGLTEAGPGPFGLYFQPGYGRAPAEGFWGSMGGAALPPPRGLLAVPKDLSLGC